MADLTVDVSSDFGFMRQFPGGQSLNILQHAERSDG